MKKTISLFFCLIVLNVSSIFAYDSNPDSYSTFFSIKYDIPLYNHQEKKELPHESEPFLNLGIAYKPSVIPILFEIDMLSITGKNFPVVLGFSADYLFGNWPKDNDYINGYLGLGAGIDVYPTQSFLSTGPRIVTGIHFDISPFFLIFEPSATKINLEFVYMPSYKMNTKNNISTIDPLNFKINFGLSFVFEGKSPVRKNDNNTLIDSVNATTNSISFTHGIYFNAYCGEINMWSLYEHKMLAVDTEGNRNKYTYIHSKITSDIDIPYLRCEAIGPNGYTAHSSSYKDIKAGIPFIIEYIAIPNKKSLKKESLFFSYDLDDNYDKVGKPATFTFEEITDTTDSNK